MRCTKNMHTYHHAGSKASFTLMRLCKPHYAQTPEMQEKDPCSIFAVIAHTGTASAVQYLVRKQFPVRAIRINGTYTHFLRFSVLVVLAGRTAENLQRELPT